MQPERQPEQRQTVDHVDERSPARPEAVERPAELLRLAHMIQNTLDEVRTLDLDEEARHRLTDVYNRTLAELRNLLSEDLQDELDDVAITSVQDTASSGELRIVQAQLVGWLQGLFQGIHASMTSQMLEAHQHQRQDQPTIGPSSGGQYL